MGRKGRTGWDEGQGVRQGDRQEGQRRARSDELLACNDELASENVQGEGARRGGVTWTNVDWQWHW